MPNKDPLIHFPFYCNEYRGMLAKYSYEEKGAFVEVLSTFIAEDGAISRISEMSKYRMFGAFTESEQRALDVVFKEAISLGQDIIKKQKLLREKKRKNGAKGGRPKYNQADNQADNQAVTYSKPKPNLNKKA